jgi:ferredoxin--NADP+ reductase
METIENLVADIDKLVDPSTPDTDSLLAGLDAKGVEYTTWSGWNTLNAHELRLGEQYGPILVRKHGETEGTETPRERVKVVDRDEQVRISRS